MEFFPKSHYVEFLGKYIVTCSKLTWEAQTAETAFNVTFF